MCKFSSVAVVITAPNCTHFNPPGLGKVAGFYVFFSAPGLKVPVGLGFLTHALEGGSSHKISPS